MTNSQYLVIPIIYIITYLPKNKLLARLFTDATLVLELNINPGQYIEAVAFTQEVCIPPKV